MPEPTTPAPPATATLTVTVHAPDAANAARWAESIGQLVTAEFSDSMRLTTSIAAPAPSVGRDTMREAIAGAIWERQNPGRKYADCEYRWRADAEADADAVLAVRDGEMDRLRDQLARAHADLDNWAAADNRLTRDFHCDDPGCTCGHRVERYGTVVARPALDPAASATLDA